VRFDARDCGPAQLKSAALRFVFNWSARQCSDDTIVQIFWHGLHFPEIGARTQIPH